MNTSHPDELTTKVQNLISGAYNEATITPDDQRLAQIERTIIAQLPDRVCVSQKHTTPWWVIGLGLFTAVATAWWVTTKLDNSGHVDPLDDDTVIIRTLPGESLDSNKSDKLTAHEANDATTSSDNSDDTQEQDKVAEKQDAQDKNSGSTVIFQREVF